MYLDNTSTIRNLSTRFVTDSEKKLFSTGLNFAIFPQYLNILDVQAEFENLYHNVQSSLSQPQRTEFKHILINLYNKYKSTYFQMKKNNLFGLTSTKKEGAKQSSEEKLVLFNLKKGPIDCYLQTRQRTRCHDQEYIRLNR